MDRPLSSPTYELPSSLLGALMRLRHPFVLTDPSRPDGPVVHASPLFLRLCGYPRCPISPRLVPACLRWVTLCRGQVVSAG